MEYKKGVATGKITLSDDLLEVSRPLLTRCDDIFAQWMTAYKGTTVAAKDFERAQSFITRYRATGVETHLPKHIDGGDVDGSLIVGLPTRVPFEGGGLTVWDGPDPGESTTYVYGIDPGAVCFLDAQVWHQSNPVTSGERWVLVVFYRKVQDETASVQSPSGEVVSMKTHLARKALGNRLRAALRLHKNAAREDRTGNDRDDET
jgi:hypothetical protein